jgi:Cys-rich protein (TIGR01571 family)
MLFLLSCVFIMLASILFTLARQFLSARKEQRRAEGGAPPLPPAAAAAGAHLDPSLRGRWLSSFWDMHELPGGADRCIFVHACFCLAAGEVAKRTGQSYYQDCCLGSIAGMWIGFYPFLYGFTRMKVRAMYGIPGNYGADVCLTGLFPCCYLAQALNQMDLAEGITASAPRMPEIYACKYSSSRSRLGAPPWPFTEAGAVAGAGKGEGAGAGAGAAPSTTATAVQLPAAFSALPVAAPAPLAVAV